MAEIVTDKSGRKIQLRRVGVLETLRLYKALGPELSLNHPYMDIAIVAASAAMIDDVPIPFPASEADVEGLLKRLGDDGVAAVDGALPKETLTEMVAEAGNWTRHPALADCLYLVRCGVPFDVAFGISGAERLAYLVVLEGFRGRVFDWKTRRWLEN